MVENQTKTKSEKTQVYAQKPRPTMPFKNSISRSESLLSQESCKQSTKTKHWMKVIIKMCLLLFTGGFRWPLLAHPTWPSSSESLMCPLCWSMDRRTLVLDTGRELSSSESLLCPPCWSMDKRTQVLDTGREQRELNVPTMLVYGQKDTGLGPVLWNRNRNRRNRNFLPCGTVTGTGTVTR
jgi:hypothetical protein